jgi:murein DD-endopeptidase MepM/ murein hydrolase activator NlpD
MVREPDQHGTLGAKVLAAAAGTVSISGWDDGGGNVVQIRHRGGWFTTYIHLTNRSVKKGEKVRRGGVLGRVGKTGSKSGDHPHLHFEQAVSSGKQATWGDERTDRVPAYFNGRRYVGESRTWRHVVSRNCHSNEFEQRNRPR